MPPSKTCDLCPALKQARTQVVPGRSVGDKPTYAIVAQNPGKEEDEAGRPLIGQSGQVAAALLKGAGISLQDVYLDNAVKCLSPGNRKPKTLEINACFIGSTLVKSSGQVRKGFRRPYSGPLVSLRTASGYQLTGTPNHPILTPYGWRRLGLLQEGEDVLSRAPLQGMGTGYPEVDHMQPCISQIVNALAESGNTERIAGADMDFHGDGSGKKVDVITANRLLEGGNHASSPEPLLHSAGRPRYRQLPLMMGERPSHQPLLAGRLSPKGFMGRTGQLPPPFWPNPPEAQAESFASAPSSNPSLREPPREGPSPYSKSLRYPLPALPTDVRPDCILQITWENVRSGSLRHVYNLETENGWYFANNIVAHNCRNFLLADLEEVDPKVIIAMGAPAVESLYGRIPLDRVIGHAYMHPVLGIPVVPTYHPAFLLRGQWGAVPLVLAHLETAMQVAAGTQQIEEMGEYHTIRTIGALEALRDYLLTCDMVHIDSETTGLNWMTEDILCLSFSGQPGTGYTVPILKRGAPAEKGFESPDWFWSQDDGILVGPLIGQILSSDVPKSLQNGSFDIRFFERRHTDAHIAARTGFNWRVNNLKHDTLLTSRTINENLPNTLKPHEQTALLGRHTGMPPYGDELKKQSANKSKMDQADDELVWGLAAADADGVARLTPVLSDKLEQDGNSQWAYNNITIPMVRACQEMTRRGILVDVPYFDKLCKWHEGLASSLEQEVYDAAGQEFNINSPQQVQKVLFEDMGLTPTKKTDGASDCAACQRDEYCKLHNSTDEESLAVLKEQAELAGIESVILLLNAILLWRSLDKRRGTYLAGTGKKSDGFKGHIRPDNRIHFSFNVLGAATQRLSSEDPNGQNIPAKVKIPELETMNAFRRTFIAPEGQVLMEADWSQLELWVLAYKLAEDFGDRALLDMLESGIDVHTVVSRAIWPEIGADLDDYEWQKEHDDVRRDGKVFTFGITYGMTIQGIMERLRCSEAVAAAHLATYFEIVPGLPHYIDFVHSAIRTGDTLENIWDMRRRFPEAAVMLSIPNRRINYAIEELYRVGVNWAIQSGGGGLHNLAHIHSEHSDVLKERAVIVNAIHDSCLFEAKAPDLDYCVETAWMIKNFWQRIAMNTLRPNGAPLGWQVPVEVKWGHDWGDLHHVLSAKGDYLDEHEQQREREAYAQAQEIARQIEEEAAPREASR